MSEITRVALDAMGGDNAPQAMVQGAVEVAKKREDIHIFLVGQEDVVHAELQKYDYPKERIQVVHASEVIETAEPPVMAIRKKKDSSIVVALNMVKKGEADAFVSAGSSGAILVGGQLIVGRIKDNPQVRVMVQDKSSLAPEGEAIAFELDKENGFSWLGHYDISVDDLLSGIPKEKKSEQAENLILEYLSKGKYPQKELVKKAQAIGISKRVLDEAKKALNVQSVKEGSQWYWQLPEKTE